MKAEKIKKFVEEGAAMTDLKIPERLLDAAKKELKVIYPEKGKETGIIQYLENEELYELFQYRPLEKLACKILRSERVKLIATASLFTQPNAKDGWGYNEEGQHVDIQYRVPEWTATPRRVSVTFVIFLDDVSAKRAPTLFRPGSHMQIAKHIGNGRAYKDHPTWIKNLPNLPFNELQPLTGKRGQVAAFTTSTLHVSSFNATKRDRRILFVSFRAAGVNIPFNENLRETRRVYYRKLKQGFKPDRRHLVPCVS